MSNNLGILGLSHVKKRIDNWNSIHKFGSNPAVGTALESIWSGGGLYPWRSGASTLIIQSDDNGDVGTVEVEGLDGDYNFLRETVTLTGSSPNAVLTTGSFLRVFRMRFTGNADHAGTIVANHTATNIAQIDPGKNQTLMAVYTIPAGNYGWLLNYSVSVGKNDDATIEVYTREPGEPFRILSEISVYQNSISKDFIIPIHLAPKTDIDIRAKTTNAGGSQVIATFDVIYP